MYILNLAMVEQPATSDGKKDLILCVVDDVMRADGRKRLSTDAESASFEFDDVFLEDDITSGRNATSKTNLVKTIADIPLNLIYCFAKLLRNSLTFFCNSGVKDYSVIKQTQAWFVLIQSFLIQSFSHALYTVFP